MATAAIQAIGSNAQRGRGRRQLCNSARLHVHAEVKAITLQLLLRGLGVIVSDQAEREAETLGVIDM